jgi:hypothetical protein
LAGFACGGLGLALGLGLAWGSGRGFALGWRGRLGGLAADGFRRAAGLPFGFVLGDVMKIEGLLGTDVVAGHEPRHGADILVAQRCRNAAGDARVLHVRMPCGQVLIDDAVDLGSLVRGQRLGCGAGFGKTVTQGTKRPVRLIHTRVVVGPAHMRGTGSAPHQRVRGVRVLRHPKDRVPFPVDDIAVVDSRGCRRLCRCCPRCRRKRPGR